MKTIKTLVFFLLGTFLLIAQQQPVEKTYLVTVTTFHRNSNLENFSKDDWKKLEMEYHDKVTKQNPFVVGQEVLTHLISPDNTEILLVRAYNNWEDIEKEDNKEEELIKAAWPDEKNRK